MAGDDRLLALDANPGPPHAPMLEYLGQHVKCGIARNRETDALGTQNDGSVDADYAAFPVDQRATRIAGIKRGVSLDHIIDEPSVARSERAPDCAHDTCRDCLLEAQGIADGD